MSKGKPSRRDLERRLKDCEDGDKSFRFYALIQSGERTVKHFVRWAFIAVIAVYAAPHIAGKHTILDLPWLSDGEKGYSDLIIAVAAFITVSALGIARWERQRSRRLIEKNAELTKQIELQQNPDRTSSYLGDDGETRKEDRT